MNALTKNIVIAAVGSTVCFLLAFWLVRPMVLQADRLNGQLLAKKTEVQSLDQQIRAYKTAESDLNHAVDKQLVYDAILTKEDTEKVVKQVEAAAQITGTEEEMKITDIFLKLTKTNNSKPQTPAVGGLSGVALVPYRLTVENTYLGLTDFMSYLEHLPNFTEITAFQLSLSGDTTASSAAGDSKVVRTGRVMGSIDGLFFIKKEAETKDAQTK